MFTPAQMGGWGMAGLLCLLCLLPAPAAAGCLVDDAAPGAQGLYKMHLHPSCTKAEREAHTVEASTLLAALKRGQTVDLDGAVIHGDLEFDSLPVASDPPALEGVLNPKDKEVRVISGGLSLVNSVVQGRIVHRSTDGALVFSGPVTFAGTTLEHTVDLSRAVFTQ